MDRLSVTFIANPFDPAHSRRRSVHAFEPGKTVGQYLRSVVPGAVLGGRGGELRLVVLVDGQIAEQETVPQPGAAIAAFFVPADPVTGAIVGAFKFFGAMAAGTSFLGATGAFIAKVAVMGVAGYALGQVISALSPTPRYDQPALEDFDSSATYAWDRGANPTTEGAALPVLYGTRRLTAPVVAQHIKADEIGNDHLYALLALCEGGAGGADVVALADYALAPAYKAVFINDNHYAHYLQPNLAASQASGDRCVGGTASASSSRTENNGPDKAFDDKTATYWLANNLTGWLQYNHGTGVRVNAKYYSILSLYGSSSYGNYPADWTFQGSNDGINWTTLDSRTGERPTTTAVYTVTGNTSFYQYHRLTVTRALPGVGFLLVSEFEVLGSSLIFPEVSIEFLAGANTQAVPAGFDETFCNLQVGKELDSDWFVYPTSAGAAAKKLGVLFSFPSGLYQINYMGNVVNEDVQIAAQYRTVSSAGVLGSWTSFPGSPWTVSGNTRSAYRVYHEVTGLSAYQFQVRVKYNVAPALGAGHVNRCVWESLQEGITDAFTYPNTALLAIEALATSALSGAFPRLSAIVSRPYVLVDGVAKSATNPAWICWDLLSNQRYGGRIDESRLIAAEFQAWADFCDNLRLFDPWAAATAYELGDTVRAVGTAGNGYYYEVVAVVGTGTSGATQPTWPTTPGVTVIDNAGANQLTWACRLNHVSCDIYCDTGVQLGQALEYVCTLGRGSIVQRGTSFGVVFDAPGSAVQLFSTGNIVAGSFREEYLSVGDLINAVEVTYFDSGRDYNRQTIEVRDSSYDDSDVEPNVSQITLFGCVDRNQAEAHGRYLLACNSYLQRTISFEADVDAIACQVGDLINVSHDMPYPPWAAGGRILSADAASATLDRSVTRLPGSTYRLIVRHADDTIEDVLLAPVLSVTTGATLLLASGESWTATPAKYDLFAFGLRATAVEVYRVIRLTKSGDQRRRITALQFDERVYSA